jgi:hypothetical protein
MAASNADATKGVLLLDLHDYTIQLAFAVSKLAGMMTAAGHGELAIESIKKGFDE